MKNVANMLAEGTEDGVGLGTECIGSKKILVYRIEPKLECRKGCPSDCLVDVFS